MIAVDTSPVVAILEKENDAERYIEALEVNDAPVMSAATFVELNAVMKHKHESVVTGIVGRFIDRAAIAIEPLTPQQAVLARDAYIHFSTLNFGDAFAYALAKDKNVPLLFKSNDFDKTDITACK